MFRGGVGRGFVAGYAGVAMIVLALGVILMCCCCWCYGIVYKRRRRLSLEERMDSEITLREDSPKFLKLLANKENLRRTSCTNVPECPSGLPMIKKCEVMYSGAICPYPPHTSFSMQA
ncbi:unnamed protein product [Orchesella dallaii]|uniref:Uncharacterized protein n=1 Tax=Orchesella dallaii TaxID=48710 RepID=A0ABP1QE86_9HEXA